VNSDPVPRSTEQSLQGREGPSGVAGAPLLLREAWVQFPTAELGSHQISLDGGRAGKSDATLLYNVGPSLEVYQPWSLSAPT